MWKKKRKYEHVWDNVVCKFKQSARESITEKENLCPEWKEVG